MDCPCQSDSLDYETMKRALIVEALTRTDGNRTEAAKLVGVSLRAFRYWVGKYDLAIAFPPSCVPKFEKRGRF